ncbi:multiple epidermal growth factor-like domains protein 10 [Saccostrea cucullata]|uniref:multiple epidermal growth factor-like domains protein 10 n=1 Tax=Saccostrea cuccullata TaxID=36930 RepID=UPI002ED329B0
MDEICPIMEGDNIKIKGYITSWRFPPCLEWIKYTNESGEKLNLNSEKYSGTSKNGNTFDLLINAATAEDSGTYQLISYESATCEQNISQSNYVRIEVKDHVSVTFINIPKDTLARGETAVFEATISSTEAAVSNWVKVLPNGKHEKMDLQSLNNKGSYIKWSQARLVLRDVGARDSGKYKLISCISPNCDKACAETEAAIKVLDCAVGFHGYECNMRCPEHCLNNDCDPIIGHCKKCLSGYKGEKCENLCTDGKFGKDCSQRCSEKCKDRKCHHITGDCMDCPPGLFGTSCLDNCPEFCLDNKCSFKDGLCTQCKPGHWGETCDKACAEGRYGSKCLERCNVRCKDGKCHHVTGDCLHCPKGFYGTGCSSPCPVNCFDKECYLKDGLCFSCLPGYRGGKCDKACEEGQYGEECRKNCSKLCQNGKCNHVTGDCDECPPGFFGSSCKQHCIKGKFGKGCLSTCSKFCRDRICNYASGECFACQDGYTGSFCSENCRAGWYGRNCSERCNERCMKEKCHHVTGECVECQTGFYGTGCAFMCPVNCLNNLCKMKDGVCLNCKPGYTGQKCLKKCEDGWYGHECTEKCSHRCQDGKCNHITGECNECPSGFYGFTCSIGCMRGKYGKACAFNCPAFCRDNVCNPANGECYTCQDGYSGVYCTEICSEGKFGRECLEKCSERCKGNKCNYVTGACIECQVGFYGIKCLDQCPKDCLDKLCNSDGSCVNCPAGRTGKKCDRDCSDGTYGENCLQSCLNCKDNKCEPTNGVCHECQQGYWGHNCGWQCPPGCLKDCRRADGECRGCVTGFYGSQCTEPCSRDCKDSNCEQKTGICKMCHPYSTGDFCDKSKDKIEDIPDNRGLTIEEGKDRTLRAGGGILTYISSDITYKRRTDFEISNIETIWLEINLKNSKPIFYCSAYRPPSAPSCWAEDLAREVNRASCCDDTEIILSGDFNIDLMKDPPTILDICFRGVWTLTDNYCTYQDNQYFKFWRNKVTQLIDQAKTSYYKSAIEESSNPKEMWGYLNQLASPDSSNFTPTRITQNGSDFENVQDIVDILNKHFTENGDHADPGNYRPISILPTLSKLFEKHIANQLREFTTTFDLIYKSQSGFREFHSCQTALTKLTDNWLQAMDQGNLIWLLCESVARLACQAVETRSAAKERDHSKVEEKLVQDSDVMSWVQRRSGYKNKVKIRVLTD